MIVYKQIIKFHCYIEEIYNCGKGILKPELLESAINGSLWYSTKIEKYLHIISCIDGYHIFNDGNKRTCMQLLLNSGLQFNKQKIADLILDFASSKISKDEFMKLSKTYFY